MSTERKPIITIQSYYSNEEDGDFGISVRYTSSIMSRLCFSIIMKKKDAESFIVDPLPHPHEYETMNGSFSIFEDKKVEFSFDKEQNSFFIMPLNVFQLILKCGLELDDGGIMETDGEYRIFEDLSTDLELRYIK
jgi:hypothetical protein